VRLTFLGAALLSAESLLVSAYPTGSRPVAGCCSGCEPGW